MVLWFCPKNIVTKIDPDVPALCSGDPVPGGAVICAQLITVSDAPGMGIGGIEGLVCLD